MAHRQTIRMPDGMKRELDRLVEDEELFSNTSEAVRYYVRQGLQREVVEEHRLAHAKPRTQDNE